MEGLFAMSSSAVATSAGAEPTGGVVLLKRVAQASSVTELNSSGAALSPSTEYTGAGVSSPVGIAVNPH